MSPDQFYKWVSDPLERAGKTFVQVYLVLVIGTGSVDLHDHQQWVLAFLPALFAGVVSLITSAVSILTGVTITGRWDLWLRVVKTGVQAFLGVIVASGATTFVVADWKDAVSVALTAAISALLAGLGTLASPNTLGASSLRTARVKREAMLLQPPAEAHAR